MDDQSPRPPHRALRHGLKLSRFPATDFVVEDLRFQVFPPLLGVMQYRGDRLVAGIEGGTAADFSRVYPGCLATIDGLPSAPNHYNSILRLLEDQRGDGDVLDWDELRKPESEVART